jgi:ABC-2 type transport system permease protein
MWRTVLGLEWRILRRDKAALGILLLFAGFVVAAALAGGRQADSVREGLKRSQESESMRFQGHLKELKRLEATQEAMTGQDPRDPIWMGQEGAATIAILPPAPLAPVAVGQRDLQPQAVRLTTEDHLSSERESETAMSGPTRLMTGAFDLGFLFVFLFPLVVIALSYELLSGERERGTLAMLLSQPVSQLALVLGKAGARAVALCGVTLVFALLGLLVAGADISGEGAWLHVFLFAAILVAWALFWFAAAVLINSFGGSSARNALQLVGLWLVLVIVIPGLVHVAVDTLYPPPSTIELLHEAREASQEVEGKLRGVEGNHDRDAKAPDPKEQIALKREIARRSESAHEVMEGQIQARQELVDWLRFASPAIIVQLALEDVAGSGATRHQRFDEQVEATHDRFKDFFFGHVEQDQTLRSDALNDIPKLRFEEEPHGALGARLLMGVFVLLLLALGLIVLALPRLRQIGRLTR